MNITPSPAIHQDSATSPADRDSPRGQTTSSMPIPPVHPPKLTECFKIHSQGATPARDRIGGYEDTQHLGDIPRNCGEIHFNRNKEKGLEKFDGKTSEFKPWRRRMNNCISEEDMSYADLIEWARTHKGVITEETENIKTSGFGGTEES